MIYMRNNTNIFPETYDQDRYIDWHEKEFSTDINLKEKLGDFRNQLKTDSEKELDLTANVINSLIATFKKQNDLNSHIDFPLIEILTKRNINSKNYDELYKSTASIINKLWRKNKDNTSNINLSNLKDHINDLIRTEIVTPTLEIAKNLSTWINFNKANLADYINNQEVKKDFLANIKSISFEPEMKMATGYFAYHGSVIFTSNNQLEIQIYSNLMRSWRKLSHKLYENNRIKNNKEKLDYGTNESKLISLGHLLHLAECQLAELEKNDITS